MPGPYSHSRSFAIAAWLPAGSNTVTGKVGPANSNCRSASGSWVRFRSLVRIRGPVPGARGTGSILSDNVGGSEGVHG